MADEKWLSVEGRTVGKNGHFHRHTSIADPTCDRPGGEGFLECMGECPGGASYKCKAMGMSGVMVRVLDESFWGGKDEQV